MKHLHGARVRSIPSTDRFALHTHDNYELYYFLAGDCEYVVEGAVYPLEPHDLLFISPGEMHRVYNKSNAHYDRIIFNVQESFFEELDCKEYLDIFQKRQKGTHNKISASVVRKSGIQGCFDRLLKYTDDLTVQNLNVINAVIMEILYLMNNNGANDSPTTNRVQQVISYINTNFTEDITLSSIADVFFVSKSHLAREFHTATGHTLSTYINKKRLSAAITMADKGESLLESAHRSGFGDYTSFYRAFCKEYGCSPKIYLKKQ